MAGGNRKITQLLKKHWLFGLIFLIAAFLRFWHLGDFDFSHDELSALYRTQFNSFSELIEKAVRIDGHPALVQVFLYYWAPLVDYSEFWIKLPSVLFGLGTMIFIYLASRRLQTGIWAAFPVLILCLSEFFLYYQTVARPYAWGGFFVAWAGYAYISYFFHKPKTSYLIAFGLAASLAAYSHYLALLSVLLMGITALIRTRKKPWPWLLTGLGVLVLFAPHLGIFKDQLAMGGVGQWLGKPDYDWLLNFFSYQLNYLPLWGPFLMIALAWLAFKSRFPDAWVWFLACFGIAFLYSHLRNPVLQFSSLIFLSPFIFFIPLKETKLQKGIPLVYLVLAILLGFSLLKTRRYYQEAHLSPPKEAGRYKASIQQNDLPVFYHWNAEKWDFYRQISNGIPKGKAIDQLDLEHFPNDFVLIMDHASPGFWPLKIIDAGYEIKERANHFGFSLHHYQRTGKNTDSQKLGITLMASQEIKAQAKPYLYIDSLSSYTLLADEPQSQVVAHIDNFQGPENAHLVFHIMDGDQSVQWIAHPLKQGSNYISSPIGDYGVNNFNWKVLIDQGSDTATCSGNIDVRLWTGNPIVYGLVQDIK